MTTELSFHAVIRGNVTPQQWRGLHAGKRDTVRAMEKLFRQRLNAHSVKVLEVRKPRAR